MMSFVGRVLSAMIVIAASALPSRAAADQTADERAIRQLLVATFDKPDDRLTVDPIVTDGDRAIAGWTQGNNGGRAMLSRRAETWSIQLCSGDALKSAGFLREIGLSAAQADWLARELAAAEARLDPSRIAQFSRFDGVVMMNEAGHPPGH